MASDGEIIIGGAMGGGGGGGNGGDQPQRPSLTDISPSSAARSLLSKLSVRKPSLLSLSSNASSPVSGFYSHFYSGERKNSSSQEDLFSRRELASITS